jgi:hypothetical protein
VNAVFGKEPEPTYPIMRIELRQDFKKKTISVSDAKGLPNHFPELRWYSGDGHSEKHGI